MIQLVEIAYQILLFEWVLRLCVAGIALFEFLIEAFPLAVVVLAVVLVLLHRVLLLLRGVHTEGLLEGEGVDLLKDRLKGDQGFLQDLVPVLVRQLGDNRDQHREGLVLVGLQDVQEVVILKEAHGPVSDL